MYLWMLYEVFAIFRKLTFHSRNAQHKSTIVDKEVLCVEVKRTNILYKRFLHTVHNLNKTRNN